MSSNTTYYNVYRVKFSQGLGPDHVALALVPAQEIDQGRGRFYHVKGSVAFGMDYEVRPDIKFRMSRKFKEQVLLFTIAENSLQQWEAIAKDAKVPHDPRLWMESKPDPPAPDCSTWVDEVVQAASHLAV